MLLDANALFLPFRGPLPVDREVDRLHPGAELAVPTSVIDELDRLVRRGVSHASAVRAFAQTLRQVASLGRGDDAILHAAVARHAWVVTADRPLAERLRDQGVTVLAPRDRSRLELAPGRRKEASPRAPERRHRGKR